MNKGQRIGTIIATAVAAGGMATVGLSGPAAAAPQPQGPRPVSNVLRAVRANTPNWVDVVWRTDRPICHAQVRYNGGPRVRIDYAGPRNYAIFSRGNYLLPGRPDFTRVRVTPYFDRSGIALLRATVQYDNCRPFARPQLATTVLTLPVIRTGAFPVGPHGPGDLSDGPNAQGGPAGHDGPGHDGPGHDGPGNGPGNGPAAHGGPAAQGGPGNAGNHQDNGHGASH